MYLCFNIFFSLPGYFLMRTLLLVDHVMSNCCVHIFVLHMLVGIGLLAVNGLPVYMFNNGYLSNG